MELELAVQTLSPMLPTTAILPFDPSEDTGVGVKFSAPHQSGHWSSSSSRTTSETHADRLRLAPRAYTTRNIPDSWLGGFSSETHPKPGDLVLVRVEKLGQHKTLHLVHGRRRTLFEGDELIAAYAHRYAPDQFEATIPENLDACHLVASGGVVARAVASHQRMSSPTRVRPVGLIARFSGGPVVNVADAVTFPEPGPVRPDVPIIAIAGTAMNAGKTTAAAHLIRGLKRAGKRVGYAKVTGTGAGCDPWLIRDAGADITLDFTDLGYVSTYRVDLHEIERLCVGLIGKLQTQGVEVIVLEIADGLFQRETAHLMASSTARSWFHGVLFAAADSMGAAAGADWILRSGHHLLGVTGTLTSSPLQQAEAASVTAQKILPTLSLSSPLVAMPLFEAVTALRNE